MKIKSTAPGRCGATRPIRLTVFRRIIVSLLGSALCAGVLYAEYDIPFTGTDVVHFQVWHTAISGETQYELKVTAPDGSETLLLDAAGAPRYLRVVCSPIAGGWKFNERIVVEDEEKNEIISENEWSETLENVINGSPCFDEAIHSSSGIYTARTVRVSQNRSLTVSGDWSQDERGSFVAVGGSVQITDGQYDDFAISASDNGSVTLMAGAAFSGCFLASGSGGTLSVQDDTSIYGSTFSFTDGVFSPGNAALLSGNRYVYRQTSLSGYGGLKQAQGTLVLASGSEGAALSGENYDIEMHTSPIQFNISNSRLAILTQASLSGGVTDTDVTVGAPLFPSSFTPKVRLSGLSLRSLSVYGAEDFEATDNEIKGVTDIGMGAPVFRGNHFIGRVDISGGSEAVLEDNALHGTLIFYGYEPDYGLPRIDNNDLLAQQAVRFQSSIMFTNVPPDGAIPIGTCYYGSERGPMLDTGGGFLGTGKGHQGGWVTMEDFSSSTPHAQCFNLAPHAAERFTTDNPATHEPPFWVAGRAFGQGTLNWSGDSSQHTLYKDVPTLLSFDVKTTGHKVSGVNFCLALDNGSVIEPSYSPKYITRDLSDYRDVAVRYGAATVNFRLPETGAATIGFELLREDRNGDLESMTEGTLQFTDHPWDRPLKIAVIPITVNYNFSSVKAPRAAPVSRFLKYVLPGMLPIPYNKLSVDMKAAEDMDTYLGLFSNLPGMAALAAKLSLWYVDALANPKYDLVVAVMPENTIRPVSSEINYATGIAPPADGVNYGYGDYFWLSTPRVLFIDAAKPMAVMHELGHAAGLYRDTEQYDMPVYKKSEGMPLRGYSAAALDAGLGNVINGLPAHGIVHFAKTNMVWYDRDHQWIDVMGLPERNVWPSAGTGNGMFSFFTSFLQTAAAAQSLSVAADVEQDETEEETADAAPLGSASLSYSTAALETQGTASVALSGIAVANRDGNTRLTDAHNTAMESSLLPRPVPVLDAAGNWYQYGRVRFFDDVGSVLSGHDFDLPDCWNQEDWWTGALPLPAGSVRIELLQRVGDTETLQSAWDRGGSLTATIDPSYLPAGELDAEFQLVWNVAASDPGADTRLVSQVCISTNAGAEWIAVGDPTEKTFRTVPTEAFPAGQPLAVRVIVSDGFSSASDTINDLVVGDRTPVLSVMEPRAGDEAETGTSWTLRANAWDIDDGVLEVDWTSSRDGALSSPTVLSSGLHTLTAAAIDQGGHLVQTSLTVRVSASPDSADLRLEDVRLIGYTREWRERESLSAAGMLLNRTNLLSVAVRNSGVPVDAEVSVQVLQPDQTTVTLPVETVHMGAFVQSQLAFAFIPEQPGVYTFTAVAIPLETSERTPHNNTRSLDTFTHLPALLVNNDYGRKEFVLLATRAYPPTSSGDIIPIEITEWLTLYNGGYVPLVVTGLNLTAMTDYYHADGGFRLTSAPALPLTLQPGEGAELELQYRATTLEPVLTGLRVQSNDPRRPDFNVPIHGWMHPQDNDQWRDEDGDGIPSFIEVLIGLDPENPDSDGDGLLDGQEDLNANGVVERWETDATDPDTDGDGLLDGAERYSSPLMVDSDGDGMTDWDEYRCRTDGRNSEDALGIRWVNDDSGSPALEWDGRSGVEYHVHGSRDLNLWEPAESGSTPESNSMRSPVIDGPQRYWLPADSPLRFYRIGVPVPQ